MLRHLTDKILDRADSSDRLKDKDALDVFRLLRGVSVDDIITRARRILADERSRATAVHAFDALPHLFGRADAEGILMTIRATSGLMSEAEVSASLTTLANDIHDALPDLGER